MKTNTFREAGFTLVEIMIVTAIIGLLAEIAIPNYIKARATAQMQSCVNNLRQIDGAKQQVLLEKGDGATLDKPTLQPYLDRGTGGSWPLCPTTQSDQYEINDKFVSPTCRNNTDPDHPHELK